MSKIISPKVEFVRLRNQVKSITPEITVSKDGQLLRGNFEDYILVPEWR
ncbi:MAG: hypothetical protein M3R36_10975 [Bacteroidota bacterium]|nr:hypothetical protein [Bacteroidota bacterium]